MGADESEPQSVETYTVEEAAWVLERTPGRVRQLLRSGDLAGEHEGGTERGPWRVYKWSAHALRDRWRSRDEAPAVDRGPAGGARRPRETPGGPESASELFRVVPSRISSAS